MEPGPKGSLARKKSCAMYNPNWNQWKKTVNIEDSDSDDDCKKCLLRSAVKSLKIKVLADPMWTQTPLVC
jgi:hypothetical protein